MEETKSLGAGNSKQVQGVQLGAMGSVRCKGYSLLQGVKGVIWLKRCRGVAMGATGGCKGC